MLLYSVLLCQSNGHPMCHTISITRASKEPSFCPSIGVLVIFGHKSSLFTIIPLKKKNLLEIWLELHLNVDQLQMNWRSPSSHEYNLLFSRILLWSFIFPIEVPACLFVGVSLSCSTFWLVQCYLFSCFLAVGNIYNATDFCILTFYPATLLNVPNNWSCKFFWVFPLEVTSLD